MGFFWSFVNSSSQMCFFFVFPEIKCFNSQSSSKHPFTVITQFVMVNCTAVEYNDTLELSFQSKYLLNFKMYSTYLFKLITMMFTGLGTAKVFSSSWMSDRTKQQLQVLRKCQYVTLKPDGATPRCFSYSKCTFLGSEKNNIKPLASTFLSGCSFTNTFPKKWLLKQLLTFFKNL